MQLGKALAPGVSPEMIDTSCKNKACIQKSWKRRVSSTNYWGIALAVKWEKGYARKIYYIILVIPRNNLISKRMFGYRPGGKVQWYISWKKAREQKYIFTSIATVKKIKSHHLNNGTNSFLSEKIAIKINRFYFYLYQKNYNKIIQ